MKAGRVFNEILKDYFNVNKTGMSFYLNFKVKEYGYGYDYYNFFDNFLFDYGVLTLGSGVVLDAEDIYMPYVNCTGNNIFKENKGCTNLNDEYLTLQESEKRLAFYLISKLRELKVEDFENWTNNNNS